MASYGIVLVPTTAAAMRAEAVLQGAGVDVKLIPVPRHLSSDCGLAIRFSLPERTQVTEALQQAQIGVIRICELDQG